MQHKFIPAIALGLGVLLAPEVGAQNGIKAFGPLGPFGYPTWYSDHQDLRLVHCIDQNDPLCGIPPEDHLVGPLVIAADPAQTNFYHESFYWSAFAALTVPGRGDAELVLAIEGVFGNAD
jgi:hypothetical protein